MPGWKYAFSLSRESVKAATPPGTGLAEHNGSQHNGRYVDRVCVAKFPTPTTDPADPLNWARWRKMACLLSVSLYAFVCNFASASLAPALPLWNLSFPGHKRPFDDLTQFIAFNVLLLGLGNIFWVPLANVFGRRPVVILSAMILFIATTCGGFASDFDNVLAVRIFQGIGSSVSETIAPTIVGDMFFIHERAGWMALFTASLASGSVLGGISGGYIAARLGWFAIFHVSAALTGTAFLCVVFLVPETIYERGSSACLVVPVVARQPQPPPPVVVPPPHVPPTNSIPPAPRNMRYHYPRSRAPCLSLGTLPSMHMTLPSRFLGSVRVDQHELDLTWYQTSSSVGDLSDHPPPRRWSVKQQQQQQQQQRRSTVRYSSRRNTAVAANAAVQQIVCHPPFTYPRSLRCGMYRGDVFYQFFKPWCTLRLPATWIVMLQYGGLVGGVAVISTVGPKILSLPPYDWGADSGLLFVGALLGIIFGCIYSTLLADQRLTEFAKRQDHGFAEPESRIPIMLPSLAIATGGLLVFGFCAEYPGKYRWIGLEFAYAMVAFALTQVPTVWFSYLIDSYAQLASDCFVMVCILRGIIPFAWTFFGSQWIQHDGYLIPFGGFTVMMGLFALLIVPLIWTGKRMRVATARYVVHNQ
ncbi:major facilitator superfamily domain-containing protein [Apodospora peruviana]|uniref:Major facilitator superfamily domain-containing protein n=1 Tax=Apodospora peruviana TaxID=516989 RepID=A0AAE0IKL1_9PEZI|nr:major facilitator superfamily domain-containing protein [Apodospora peruviana]